MRAKILTSANDCFSFVRLSVLCVTKNQPCQLHQTYKMAVYGGVVASVSYSCVIWY
jgi:hypothetical protein